MINSRTKLCVIIGDPIDHSLSPLMHNAAYKALGIDDEFVFLASRVKIEKVGEVVSAVREMGIRGLTCTIPHKVEVMKYLDWIDPIAKKIGAVNSVVNENGVLKGYNTDWIGVIKPLEQVIQLKGKKVALIGAGGAARAMAYGARYHGARLTIFNRTLSNAEILANEFGAIGKSLSELGVISEFDVVLNATNIGMGELIDESPIPKEYLRKHQVIFDAVYLPYETKLMKEAKAIGATVIHGVEMLLHQGSAQFELYTGQKAPEEIMMKAVYDELKIQNLK